MIVNLEPIIEYLYPVISAVHLEGEVVCGGEGAGLTHYTRNHTTSKYVILQDNILLNSSLYLSLSYIYTLYIHIYLSSSFFFSLSLSLSLSLSRLV